MVAERPYSPALAPEAAITELLDCAGSQFDPDVVAALVAQLSCARVERPAAPTRRAASRSVVSLP
jgi:HD-GYP domain-containing protein (c-di-GMP phosphodiesterase class II)